LTTGPDPFPSFVTPCDRISQACVTSLFIANKGINLNITLVTAI
jgi:hypothetical protein